MKKIWLATLVLLITPMAQANEIPGTRVAGQGAVCGEGEGKALEINATTKQEWSYCFKREIFVAPTPTPIPTPSPTTTATQTTSTTSTESAPTESGPTSEPTYNAGSATTSESSTVTVQPSPTPSATPTATMPSAPQAPERSNVYEVNATTNVTTVREESIEEWLGRILAGWTSWYEALSRWFESLFN